MIFRQATPADLPQLCELLEMLFAIETDFHFDADKVSRGLDLFLSDQTTRAIWVACEGELVLGMCSAQLLISTAQGSPSAWVEDVILRPEVRGQGIMPQLLNELEAWCVARGATRLQILCDQNNAPALRFYPKQGFEFTQLVALQKFPE